MKLNDYLSGQQKIRAKCEKVLRELEIDSYPIATLVYLKFRNQVPQASSQELQSLKKKI